MYKVFLGWARGAPEDRKPKLIDIGCCSKHRPTSHEIGKYLRLLVGTELRSALYDGYPSDQLAPNLIGCDLRTEFIQYGHELYQDGPTSDKPAAIAFFQSDLFDEGSALASMKGKINYIHTAAVFHLFDKSTQQEMAERLLDLLNVPERADNEAGFKARGGEYIMFGSHDGREQEQVLKDRYGDTRYAHSPTSWIKMWNAILVKKYGEEWVKLRVKQDAYLGKVYEFPEKPDYPTYRDLVWSVHITV